MSSSDDILAAIDSAVRDYTVGPDAMRYVPDGTQSPSGSGYTSGSGGPEWTYRSLDSFVHVDRCGQPWGTFAPAEQYVVSDGEQEAVMPPPPVGPGVYFGTMGEPGTDPQWQRIDGYIIDDGLVLEDASEDTLPWADRLLQAGPMTITLYAESSGFEASYERFLIDLAAFCTGWGRRRVAKSEYARRRRNRRRNR